MKVFIFLLVLLTIISCKKPTDELEKYNFSDNGIFVVNEGNYTYGNSSLSFIDLEADTIYNQIFFKTNGIPLGDVAQSIEILNDYAFVVVNNSGKIFVIDKNTGKYIHTIENLTSPRYVEIINESKAYITDLYSNQITIFNPQTFEITGFIQLGCSTEKILKYENYAFVSNWSYGNKIFKINTDDNLVDTFVNVNLQPNSIVIDKNERLWVLSDGGNDSDTANNEFAALTCFDAKTMELIKKIEFQNKYLSPSHLQINKTFDSLYFLQGSWSDATSEGGIYKMSVDDNILPEQALIEQNSNRFYSYMINSKNQIIIGDALDFSKEGNIFVYNQKLELVKTYRAGIIPGFMIEKK